LLTENATVLATPATEACTVYVPTVPLAVNTEDVAMPDALLWTAFVFELPAKVPLAPELGAVKVTAAPFTALPNGSFIVTTKGAPKTALIFAVWPEPLVMVIEFAEPA